MVALAKIFGKTVVDPSNDSPSLTVLFINTVDIRIVVSSVVVVVVVVLVVVAVVTGLMVVVLILDIAVVVSITGTVKDTAVVRTPAVTLLSAALEVFSSF